MRFFIALLFLSTSARIFAQEKRFVEEIAFYHLTNLIETQESLKHARFYASGDLRSDTTSYLDTLIIKKNDAFFVPNPFDSCIVIDKRDLQHFDIPPAYRGKKKDKALQIKHAWRMSDTYYVHFSWMETDSEGFLVVLVLDLKGNLIRYKALPISK